MHKSLEDNTLTHFSDTIKTCHLEIEVKMAPFFPINVKIILNIIHLTFL